VRSYLARRLLLLVPVLVGVSVVVFLVLHLSPGDPAEIMLGSQATQEDLARLRRELGLTEPLHVQYVHWVAHVARGDLGRSIWMKRPVLDEVLNRYKATLVLTASGLLLSTVGGIILGVASAVRPHSFLDRMSAVTSLFGASMPVFWLGIVLMVVFSLWLGWLPASGMWAPYGEGGLRDLLAVLTETVFAWPGVGLLMVQGILARDFPLVQGCVLVIALTFVLINLAVDLLYAWLDPRIQYE